MCLLTLTEETGSIRRDPPKLLYDSLCSHIYSVCPLRTKDENKAHLCRNANAPSTFTFLWIMYNLSSPLLSSLATFPSHSNYSCPYKNAAVHSILTTKKFQHLFDCSSNSPGDHSIKMADINVILILLNPARSTSRIWLSSLTHLKHLAVSRTSQFSIFFPFLPYLNILHSLLPSFFFFPWPLTIPQLFLWTCLIHSPHDNTWNH